MLGRQKKKKQLNPKYSKLDMNVVHTGSENLSRQIEIGKRKKKKIEIG